MEIVGAILLAHAAQGLLAVLGLGGVGLLIAFCSRIGDRRRAKARALADADWATRNKAANAPFLEWQKRERARMRELGMLK